MQSMRFYLQYDKARGYNLNSDKQSGQSVDYKIKGSQGVLLKYDLPVKRNVLDDNGAGSYRHHK